MEAILDESGVRKAVVGGLSLGGYLSLAFYLHHPDRVVALMLFDTGPGFKSNEARAEWNRMAEETALGFETKGLEALPDRPEVRISKHYSAQGLARAARGILSQRDSRVIESLPKISVPTLIVVGELDTPFLAASDYMARKVPNAIKVVIKGAGHASNIDNPQAFNNAILDFLEKCE
jgi:pimeloyl-ACP methyl ester carboxylesterase